MTEAQSPLPDDPLWYQDAVIYQTHVKAFFDTDGDGVGDLRGLTQKLDYIRDLGVDAIWLLPFYPSPMRDDGYDIADYRNIHPTYGSRRDFRRFVGAAHRRGIRVIIELVINHTSDQHPWFQAARRAPRGSAKRDFYVWSDDDRRFAETRIIFTDSEASNWTWDPLAGQFYWHRFFSHQPDLNHNNPRVVRAVIRVMRFWLDLGVDGLRLDAIPYLCVRDGTSNENLPETHAVIRQMRAVVDANYKNRLFLAEANQWPEDVREYFGEGDECHMAYHFPLMPRMYMALAQEDRHPVVEILEQTPDIPAGCQWAIFLRNHDELTLEMVSDRERDYMYRAYAEDPRMRVNVGIRRRLAPLLDNDPAKVRLMFSLLLSMPGSPILYYGDELGMGDNIYLGDRNGVRTPMQWSPDRNAGFSRADPQRLYLPPIMDPVFGYLSVNVEAQAREAPSLLNWMRRVIAVRRAHRVFGRGTLDMLHPGNRRILAYVREHGEGEAAQAVLCVANLGRGAEPVELDLARFRGRVPVELLGETAFPPIGDLPYLLTLPGHGFYWFLLSREADAPAWHQEHLPRIPLRTLVLPEGWRSLDPARAERRAPAERAREQLEAEVLPAWLGSRRWLAGGAGDLRRASLIERQEWRDWLLAVVRVERVGGEAEDCFLPFSIVWEDAAGQGSETPLAGAALARVRRHALPGTLYDGLADPELIRALVQAIGADRELPFGAGRLRCRRASAYPPEAADSPRVEIQPEGAAGDALIDGRVRFSARRLLCPGADLEVEIGRHLTEVAPVACVRALAGTLEYLPAGGSGEVLILGLLQRWAPDQGDLWSQALEMLLRLMEEHLDQVEDWETDPARMGYTALLEALGRRLAELHLALATPDGNAAFAPEPIDAEDLAAWRDQLLSACRTAFESLAEMIAACQARGLEDLGLCPRARALLARRAEIAALALSLTPERLPRAKTRVHGDLHLGHVLAVEGDVLIEGFRGDALGACVPRPSKLPPLADLASLLESLHAVAATALASRARGRSMAQAGLESALRQWRRDAETALTRAYRAGPVDAEPEGAPHPWSAEEAALLHLLALERALARLAGAAAHAAEPDDASLGAALDTLVSVLDDWTAVD